MATSQHTLPAIHHSPVTEVTMGKGDKRSRKGKIFKGSYGKTRPHDPSKKKEAPKPRAGRGQPAR